MVHVEAIQKSISAQGLAAVYAYRIFRYHGVPQSIVSDRDARFTSLFWQDLSKRLGTKFRMSTTYHPQTDGQTERVNGVLEDILRHFVGPYQNDWDDLLAPVEFALNNSWHHSIRNTPFMLNYGQVPDNPTVALGWVSRLNVGERHEPYEPSKKTGGVLGHKRHAVPAQHSL